MLVALLAMAGWSGPAAATVPSGSEGNVVPLCTSGDRMVMLYRDVFAAGGPHFHVYDWQLEMVDLGAWVGQTHDMGWVLADNPPNEPDNASYSEEYGGGDSASIVESLAQWGMVGCFFEGDDKMWTVDPLDFQYDLSVEGLTIQLAGRSRKIEDLAVVLPGRDEMPTRECVRLLVNKRFAPTQPWPDVELVCEAERAREQQLDRPMEALGSPTLEQALSGMERVVFGEMVHLQTKMVLPTQVHIQFGEYPVLLVLDNDVVGPALSYLVNALGFDAHERGEFAVSDGLFYSALLYDGDNETARYNLACSKARIGQLSTALDQLAVLPATAELRAKIEEDADFDEVRHERRFVDFMQRLPAE